MTTVSLENIIKNSEEYTQVVTLILAVGGAIVACVKVIVNMCATAMATPVEIALMKKGEQYKHALANFGILWFSFTMILVLLGVAIGGSNFEYRSEKNSTSMYQNEQIEDSMQAENGFVSEESVDTVMKSEQAGSQVQVETKKDNMTDAVVALMFILGFFGTLYFGLALLLLWCIQKISQFICRHKKEIQGNNKEVLGGIIKAILLVMICVCIVILKVNLIWKIILIASVCIGVSYVGKKGFEKGKEVLKNILLVFGILLSFGLNGILVWNKDNYTSVGSILWMILASTILALVTCFFLYLIIVWNANSGKARVKYFNKILNKDIYLYSKYNDEFFLAGEKEKLEECQVYYLVKVDDVLGDRLERITSDTIKRSSIYGENIILQLNGKGDIALDGIMSKLFIKLENAGVTMDEYRKTKIYINEQKQRVYFYLPNEKIPREEQNFEL